MKKLIESDNKDLVQLNVDLLKPSPLNSYEVEDLSDLVNSIRYYGVITPLTVVGPDGEGKYEILSGERRYRSVQMLNEETQGFLSEVPCYIIGQSSMSPVLKQLVIELSNLEARDEYNRDSHRFQVIKLYKQLADEGTIEEKDIVKQIGESLKLSKRYSGMYMTIFRDGIPELREAVESENKVAETPDDKVHIPVSIASRIAKLDPDLQKKVIVRINNGEDPSEVLRDVKKIRSPMPEAPQHEIQPPMGGFMNEPVMDDINYPKGTASDAGEDEFRKPADFLYDEEDLDEYDDPFASSDDSLRAAAQNQDDFDTENFDVLGFMKRHTSRVDLDVDTSDELGRMKGSEKANTIEADDRKHVSSWIRRITRKLEKNETLEEEDVNLIELISDLVEQYNA